MDDKNIFSFGNGEVNFTDTVLRIESVLRQEDEHKLAIVQMLGNVFRPLASRFDACVVPHAVVFV
jgi:hypothetical protein